LTLDSHELTRLSRPVRFANDVVGTENVINSKFDTKRVIGFMHPYPGSPVMVERVYVFATKFIPAGTEIFVSYGGDYKRTHLQ